MIQVIENVLPQEKADSIENTLMGEGYFPWYIKHHITYGNMVDNIDNIHYGYSHYFIAETNIESTFAWNVIPIITSIADKIDFNINTVFNMRAFLHNPSTVPGTINSKHIDMDRHHYSCIYYVNDSDGDTVFFDSDSDNIIKRYTPKKNTAVFFDGSINHSSTTPSQHRCIINTNVW
jgi:hypothetical protein